MIGLLYESGEWSDYKLAAELCEAGCEVCMIDVAHLPAKAAVRATEECGLLVSRVFASAVFRGHSVAHEVMERVCNAAEERGIPMVNPARAHFFEIDKRRATEELARAGIDVPVVLACGTPTELLALLDGSAAEADEDSPSGSAFRYPCIIKPNCGGRTTCTAVARTSEQARAFLAQAPGIAFIVEDYIEPERGFVTRAELVGGVCRLVVKRSVVESGLSAYHLGSRYRLYPDCPAQAVRAVLRAGEVLDIGFGSFDVIESGGRAFIIDANSVSNVSPDNTETFGGFDLMREYARAIRCSTSRCMTSASIRRRACSC